MATVDAIDPTLRKIESTLASGHRVWIVGLVGFLPPNVMPPTPGPALLLRTGWNSDVYTEAWTLQMCRYIQINARNVWVVPVEAPQPVNLYEDMPLTLVEGWKAR